MEKKPTETVWARVKEALRDAGRAPVQASVVRILGIKQGSISEWNKPHGRPKIEHAVLLSRELKVCVQWIYEGNGPKKIGRPDDAIAVKLWDLWPLLSEESRTYILGYATAHKKPAGDGGPGVGEPPKPKVPRPFPHNPTRLREKRRAEGSRNLTY